ncbi:transposase [Neobacillus notoginsengisoli]|uniref:Transposase n=2 Tax=Neobacillus notoginsengisoli TaxID=1578198 RepID=A0A417YYS9_9BACI|nr:transposase [Neobacillus notoginsengisoli]
MARGARIRSKSGMYHVMFRGANKQEIFHDEADRVEFLRILRRYKEQSGVNVYAWCVMGNHVHLLLKEGEEGISLTMKRLGISYAQYYNGKYGTNGHLFQDRFRSENVESVASLLRVVRYIHQNPVKAGLVRRNEEWKWSSCRAYYDPEHYMRKWLDGDYILGLLPGSPETALKIFKAFTDQPNNDEFLEYDTGTRRKIPDEEASKEIKKLIGQLEIPQIKSLPKPQRDHILRKIKTIQGITQRQAARIIGISPNLVFRVK